MKGATFIYISPPPSDQGNGFKTRAVKLASYNGELCGKKHEGVVSTATSLSVHALLHLPQRQRSGVKPQQSSTGNSEQARLPCMKEKPWGKT